MGDRIVVEWAPFRLAEGVSEEQLTAASQGLQDDFLAGRRGFLKRELLRGPNGDWVDLVHWSDGAAAEDAMKAAAASPVCHAYFGLMVGGESTDPESGVTHFARVASYGRHP